MPTLDDVGKWIKFPEKQKLPSLSMVLRLAPELVDSQNALSTAMASAQCCV